MSWSYDELTVTLCDMTQLTIDKFAVWQMFNGESQGLTHVAKANLNYTSFIPDNFFVWNQRTNVFLCVLYLANVHYHMLSYMLLAGSYTKYFAIILCSFVPEFRNLLLFQLFYLIYCTFFTHIKLFYFSGQWSFTAFGTVFNMYVYFINMLWCNLFLKSNFNTCWHVKLCNI